MMVNYCCIVGCGRNSKSNKLLNFYSLPKQKQRQKQWLKAAGKDDLLDQDMEKLRKNLRFCSRHFPPSSIKNKHLNPDAVPSIRLPGSLQVEHDILPAVHDGIICDVCSEQIVGFRYKCVTCDNYDLCQKCEMLEVHDEHYMLRIPKSLKFKLADNLINKWRQLFQAEHITVSQEMDESNSSDDEPITKYIKNDSSINLSEEVKYDIKNEIQRALKSLKTKQKSIKIKTLENNTQANFIDMSNSVNTTPHLDMSTSNNPFNINTIGDSSNFKNEEVNIQNGIVAEISSQLIFAETNEMKCEDNNIKSEAMASLSVVNTTTESGQMQPVIYLKLNDVLTQLMITPSEENATSNNTCNIFQHN